MRPESNSVGALMLRTEPNSRVLVAACSRRNSRKLHPSWRLWLNPTHVFPASRMVSNPTPDGCHGDQELGHGVKRRARGPANERLPARFVAGNAIELLTRLLPLVSPLQQARVRALLWLCRGLLGGLASNCFIVRAASRSVCLSPGGRQEPSVLQTDQHAGAQSLEEGQATVYADCFRRRCRVP
jgi:hypothetical protein